MSTATQASAPSGVTVSSADMTRMAGITFKQLHHWHGRGLVVAEERVRGGPGFPRRWPATEVEVARRIGVLVAAGVSLEVAATFARDGWPRAEIAPGVALEVAG